MNKIIARFPPSPTGPIHLGNLRTALYNFLYIKKNNGKFYIRMEDTDQERSSKVFEQEIIDILDWIGVKFDTFQEYNTNKLFRQSERLAYYQQKAQEFYEKGYAYYCQCQENPCICQGKSYKSGALRLVLPKNQVLTFNDMVCGMQSINSNNLENFVILRQDSWPTYNFVVVLDDDEMGVNLVGRGKDHLTNTFKQIIVYQYLNKKIPTYAHFPIILGDDGKKLSKRNGNASALYYKKQGYAMEAVRNAILRTGWGYKDDEMFTLEEAIEKFELNRVSVSSGVLNMKKLLKQSRYYLRTKEDKYLPMLCDLMGKNIDSIVYKELVKRYDNLGDMVEYLTNLDNHISNLTNLPDNLSNIKHWSWQEDDLRGHIRILSREEKTLLRKYLTGQDFSIGLVELLIYVGQDKVIRY